MTHENDIEAQNKEAANVTLDDIMDVVNNHDSVIEPYLVDKANAAIEPLVSEWGRVYSNV